MRRETVPSDVARLVIAARNVAFDDAPSPEALHELDQASEAFADRVPWEDEPASPHSPLQDDADASVPDNAGATAPRSAFDRDGEVTHG